jgi:hypothetical protein
LVGVAMCQTLGSEDVKQYRQVLYLIGIYIAKGGTKYNYKI